MRGSRPGERRGGRQKGTPNKITLDLKTALLLSFDAVGGAAYLEKIARENPAAYCQLLAKILPKEIRAEHTVNNREVEQSVKFEELLERMLREEAANIVSGRHPFMNVELVAKSLPADPDASERAASEA